MEIALLIIFILLLLASTVVSSIQSHYQRKYNKLLEEQNDLLLEDLKLSGELIQINQKILKLTLNTNGGNNNE